MATTVSEAPNTRPVTVTLRGKAVAVAAALAVAAIIGTHWPIQSSYDLTAKCSDTAAQSADVAAAVAACQPTP